MNKIIRFASVIAIVCASLVYAGCTKDFSSDIARLEGEKATKADVEKVNAALEAFKTEANAQLADLAAKKADKTTVEALQQEVNDLKPIVNKNKNDIADLTTRVGAAEGSILKLQADLGQEIADRKTADQAVLDSADRALKAAVAILNDADKKLGEKDVELENSIITLKKYADSTFTAIKKDYAALNKAQQDQIDTLFKKVERLEGRVDALEDAVAVLQGQVEDIIAMVQSITFIPGSYNHNVYGVAEMIGRHDHDWDPQLILKDTVYAYEWINPAKVEDWWKAFIAPGQWKKITESGKDTLYFPGITFDWSWTAGPDGNHEHALAGTTAADAVAYDYKIEDNKFISNPIFSGTIMVTPATAAEKITKDNLSIRVVATKAWAAEANDTTIKVTYVKARKDNSGYVDFVAAIKNPDATKRLVAGYDVVAMYDAASEKENGVEEHISTNPFNVVTAASVTGFKQETDSTVVPTTIDIKPIVYKFYDKKAGKLVDSTYLDAVVVDPTCNPVQTIFEPSRFEVYAAVEFQDFKCAPLAEIEALLGAKAGSIKPLAGDTTLTVTFPNPVQLIEATDKGLNTTVAPIADETVATVIQKVIKSKGEKKPVLLANLGLANKQLFTTEDQTAAYNASRIFGAYVVVPAVDSTTAKFITGGEDVIELPWNWDLAVNPVDTTVDAIAVSDVDSLIRIAGNNWDEAVDALAATNTVIKIYNEKSGVVYNASGSAITKVNSNTVAAKIKATGIEYGVGDSTYVFEVYRFDNERAKMYVASFTFGVAAKPADVAFDFGVCDTLVLDDLSEDLVIKNDFSKKLFQYINSKNDVTIAAAKQGAVIAKAALAPVTTQSYIATDSTVVKSADLKYGQDIVVKDTLTTYYGFKVAVKHTIKINKPAVTLVSVPEYVLGSNGKYTVNVKSYVDERNVYQLETMPFEQYLTVAGNTKKYNVHANLTPKTGKVDDELDWTVGLKEDGIHFAQDIINWGDLDTTCFDLGVALKTANNEATLDTATIHFQTVDPLTFTAKNIEATEAFHAATTVNLFPALSLVDLNDVELVDAEDNRLHHIYGEYVNYGQKNVTFEIVKYNEDLKPYASIENNAFVLDWNQARLTQPVVFTVKATVDYIFGTKTATFDVTINPIED